MASRKACKTPLQIADDTEAFLRNPDPNRQRDLDVLRSHIDEDLRANIDSTSGNRRPDLRRLIGTFGRVFLAGGLEGVSFCWDDTLFGRKEEDPKDLGATQYFSDGSVDVTVCPAPELCEEWLQVFKKWRGSELVTLRTDGILSTLLHECIHAKLAIARCRKGKCGGDACEWFWDEEVGEGGHGAAWQLIAKSVEDFVRENELWDCDLGRKTQAQKHLSATGGLLSKAVVAVCWPGESIQDDNGDLVWA